jgi:uncharacterized membrane protein HdeD (DUF308 family)
MEYSLVRNWWAVGLVGVVAVLVGVTAFLMPLSTLASIVFAFGGYALVSGILHVAAGLSGEGLTATSSRGWLIATGVLGIIAGGLTLLWPGLSAVMLYTVIATWAVLAGITQVVAAIALRDQLKDTWLVALGGAVMVILGVYLFARPGAGVLALAYAFGVYAVIYGISMIAASVMLNRVKDRVDVTIGRVEQPMGVTREETTRR